MESNDLYSSDSMGDMTREKLFTLYDTRPKEKQRLWNRTFSDQLLLPYKDVDEVRQRATDIVNETFKT